MDLDRSFGFLVHDVARLFGRRFNQRALLFLGLTRAQCKVLGYLARNEGINQAGLADLLEIKPMTLGRQLIELLRRAHANLSERVPPLAAELADLDEPDDGLMVRAPSTQADLSPVGGGL